jgi:cobalt/nickel transport system permease protein
MHFMTHHHNHDHFLSRIDPRLKLLCALGLLVMVLSNTGYLFPLATAALCVTICLWAGLRPKTLAVRFAEPLFIMLMIVLLKLFFVGSSSLFSLSLAGVTVAGYREGLLEGLHIASRILGGVAVVNALVAVTTFTDLAAALSWLRVPRVFIEIALFTWRYLFLIFDDAKVIYGAQKNRLGYAGYRQGLRSFGTLAGSLVIKAFDNSRNVTTAMVQRGYDGSLPMLSHKPFRLKEVAASLALILCMGLLWRI